MVRDRFALFGGQFFREEFLGLGVGAGILKGDTVS
jgi:hypothetical protein